MTACERAAERDDGRPASAPLRVGERYEALVVVTQRAEPPREVRDFLRPSTDSLRFPLVVDSVRGDSLFGSWYADFHQLGTYGDDWKAPRPYPWRGLRRRDSVALVLSANHPGQDVHLRGTPSGRSISGRWETTYEPRLRGTFELRGEAAESADRESAGTARGA